MLINYIKPDFVHQDERGGLYQLVSKGFNQVNYIYSKADMVRGGHFHKINKEIFVFIDNYYSSINFFLNKNRCNFIN